MTKASSKDHIKRRQIKLNRRGLTELVLACSFLSLFTFALWSWQNNGGYVTAMDSTAPAKELLLMPQILRHPAIMLSTVVTEFILLLAFALAIVPMSWWLRADHLVAGENTRLITPLRWLGEKLGLVAAPQPGHFVVNDTGELVFVPEESSEPTPDQPEIVMMEQPDGTMMPMVKQPDGTLAPAESEPAADAANPGEPLQGLAAPTENVLNFDEEEEDPLADLADIGDILNAAFDDDVAIDPHLEAISRSLDNVDVMVLLKNAQNVLATFKQ